MAVSIVEAIRELAPGVKCNIYDKKGYAPPKKCVLASERLPKGNSPIYTVVCEGVLKGNSPKEIPIAIVKGRDEELGIPFDGLTGEETIFVSSGKRKLQEIFTG